MKIAIFIILGIASLFLVESIYRGFFRPIDPLTDDVRALSKFLNKNGVEGSPYPVRHGYRHSRLLAAAAFRIENYPLPIAIGVYPSNELASRSEAANTVHNAISNESIVVSFPAWGEDTEEMRQKIKDLFRDFKQ